MNPPIKICLTGLVSSGKTTMINSLTGKRLSETGITRTTKVPKLYGKKKLFQNSDFYDIQLKSDDDYEYCILDLPGVNDSEDKTGIFDEQTKAYILSFDIILWVSDVHTSFSTKHEKEQFESITNILEQNSLETGTIYQYGIVLTKYDKSTNQVYDVILESDDENECVDEIITDREESNIDDKYKFVTESYPHIPIIKFNSHGRIIHGKSSSNLKKLVQTLNTCPTNNNITFNLGIFVGKYEKVRTSVCEKSLKYFLQKILSTDFSVISFEYITKIKKLSTKYTLAERIVIMETITGVIIKLETGHKYFYTLIFHLYELLMTEHLLRHFCANFTVKKFIWLLSDKREHKLAFLREYANTIPGSRNERVSMYQLYDNKRVLRECICLFPLYEYYSSDNKNYMFLIKYIPEISYDIRIHTDDFYKLSLLKEIEKVRKELYGPNDDCNIIAMMTEARTAYCLYKSGVKSSFQGVQSSFQGIIENMKLRSILSAV